MDTAVYLQIALLAYFGLISGSFGSKKKTKRRFSVCK